MWQPHLFLPAFTLQPLLPGVPTLALAPSIITAQFYGRFFKTQQNAIS